MRDTVRIRQPSRARAVARDPREARVLWVAFVAPLMAAVLFLASVAQARPAPESFADLAEQLLPAVVNISTTQTISTADRGAPDFDMPPGTPFEDLFRDFFDREGQEPQGPRRANALGSGFIVSPDGYVVTNNHVIEDADEITVILQNDTQLKAELIGRDEQTDLALLRVQPSQPLPYVKWGDSDALRVGDWVMAIGNPFGLGGTVTAGIVSARARNINAGPYDDFIQTDASINRGNSGGPLFNMDGQVVGINTAIFSPTGASVGIGFAVPAALAQNVIEQLQEDGKVRRGWLGVTIQSVTPDIAEGLGLEEAQGALVSSVAEDGPAARAGIEPGDVIISFNGQNIDEMRRLPRVVAETRIDAEVPVTVWRQGDRRTVQVRVGDLDSQQARAVPASQRGDEPSRAPAEASALGLTVAEITPELRERFDLRDNAEGVIVTAVDGAGAASERGLQPGDLIREVGQVAIASPAEFMERIEEARAAGRRSALLLVDSGGDLRFVALPLS